ncbi:hypothetical protein ARC20_03170 [Stenotrophomonas panacihumi]|uniref:HK97 gp10 family phage protein n=1 Tax=Stenotrophomonas panacihumi TaxID=676599 RepID=A0A0R0B0P2_9GAMM|nr:hypothetical protein [Stenotrophomonas panacihumi]KRG47345.1 hypothetical protein ARC20_03170 [Stenotrophomonas panacihumi]PTN55822.1 hypothetical protein C9J98_04410 [Stenotrophomonas panacihumi]
MASKFGDQVKSFAERAKLRQQAIFRESAQELLDEANTPEAQGGKMPVDTSFLRNSSAASTDGVPSAGGAVPQLVFLGLEIGQSVWIGWTAAYAMRIEHGFYGEDRLGRKYAQAGKGFARAAAQNWPFIVQRATLKVKEQIP